MLLELKFYVVSALVNASIWALPAAAISLVYGVLRYPNFAIPEYMTVGAYLGLVLAGWGLPLPLAGVAAACLTGLIAVAWDQTVFRRVRSRGILPAVLLSLGLMLVLQNVVRFIWGNDPRQYPIELSRPYMVGGFVITPTQIASILAAVVTLALLVAVLRLTRFGRAVRATSNNPDLAIVSGVPPEMVYAGVAFAVGAMAAIGGVVLATETTVSPLLGWRTLIPAFAVAVFGGLGSLAGAGMAAVILALVTEFSLFALPATYKTALAFVVLALVLLVRPSGLVRVQS